MRCRHLGAARLVHALAKTLEEGIAEGASQALLLSLQLHDWNTAAVARDLGVTRKTVYARMKRWRVPTRKRTVPATGSNAS